MKLATANARSREAAIDKQHTKELKVAQTERRRSCQQTRNEKRETSYPACAGRDALDCAAEDRNTAAGWGTSRRTTGAICRTSSISAANCSGYSDCMPSDSARSGL